MGLVFVIFYIQTVQVYLACSHPRQWSKEELMNNLLYEVEL